MACPSAVRIATEADRLGLWRLILQGYKEIGMFSLAPDKIDWWLTRVLNPAIIPEWDIGPRGAIGVIGPSNEIEGMCFVVFGTAWYSHDKHLEEYMVCVDPECRNSGHVKALIAWMQEQSEETRLPLVTGVISNPKTEAKCRLYRRTLPKIGEYFLFNPNGHAAVTASAMSS